MRPHGPTFLLLDGLNGWCTASAEGSSESLSGICLAAAPNGPLSLNGDDGSLGGLVLPPVIAIDEQGQVYLLVQAKAKVKRFDPQEHCFKDLPGIGGHGSELRRLHPPAAITVAAGHLYLADPGNRRLQVLDLKTLALPHVWGPADMGGEADGIHDSNRWEPVDLAVADGAIYILDRYHARVYRHRPGTDRLVLLFEFADNEGGWSRIALDREGRVYLLNADAGLLDVFSHDGRRLDTIEHPGAVRDRFQLPLLRLGHRGRFCIPAGLVKACGRQAEAPPVEIPLAGCLPPVKGGLVFDRSGNPASLDPAERPGPKPFLTEGEWLSRPLNSQIHRCQWHRIELELADLPVGSRVEISTYSEEQAAGCCHEEDGLSPEREQKRAYVPEHLWKSCFTVAGPMQPPQNSGPIARRHEFLVQSREGQYLRLRLALAGDGYATPVVRAMRVHYPRHSYLEYLPALFAEDDNSRWFLERFLSIFQTEWERYEQYIEEMPGLFDPKAVPDGAFLTWLASLVGLPLEGEWDWDQKRRLLVAIPELYKRRGTGSGLRDFLQIYLANMTGLTSEQVVNSGFPYLVEGFREREHLMLNYKHASVLGHGAPLWGPGKVGRLQTDLFAREGEARLVSIGDPQRDWFHQYAHRFRVFVPAAWVRTAKDERMLQRALDAEKPAHTQYELCLVESRLQIGVRSSVGLDTIIGDYPKTYLGCAPVATSDGRAEVNTPPVSLHAVNRLGIDTVLSGVPDRRQGLRLGPGERLAAGNRLN